MSPELPVLPSLEEFAGDVADAAGFTAGDVAANRNGWISTRQFFRLLAQAARPVWSAFWVLLAWTVVMLVGSVLFRRSLMRLMMFHSYLVQSLAVTAGAGLAFVVALLRMTRTAWCLAQDLYHGQALAIEGRLTSTWFEEDGEGLRRFQAEKTAVCYYWVRQERFQVQPPAHELLRTKYDSFRPKVRLYFAPRSRLLLSLEPVTTPAAAQG